MKTNHKLYVTSTMCTLTLLVLVLGGTTLADHEREKNTVTTNLNEDDFGKIHFEGDHQERGPGRLPDR